MVSTLSPHPLSILHRFPSKPPSIFHPNPNPNPTFIPKCSISSSYEREEQRWLREEQRWLREESRWVREESRWRSEREFLLREIAALRRQIEERSAVSDRIDLGGAQSVLAEDADVKEMVLEEVRVLEGNVERKERKMMMLRKGSEGDEVRAMQEALQRLGFYSGEEDMEYSSFSSGTERAVKTWQASLGTLEDGIMTSELLERLFAERSLKEYADEGGDTVSKARKDDTNGAAIASVAEIKQTVIKGSVDADIHVPEHRVFLLGENRWEEPSRLVGRDKPTGRRNAVSPTKCLTCRGEGQLLCSECDGTGEPNIEPQFLEWVGEDSKCPYCEGRGFTICDVCEGKTGGQS